MPTTDITDVLGPLALTVPFAQARQASASQRQLWDQASCPHPPNGRCNCASLGRVMEGSPVRGTYRVIDHHDRVDYTSLVGPAGGSALVRGDAEQVLAAMPADSVQTVVTSPPYWSLRDYGIEEQIGLEESVDLFIKRLVQVFDQVSRVLRGDGTLWLNIGDSYTSGGRTWRAPDKKNRARAMRVRPATPDGLKPKDLIGVPWRLAFALQSSGWYLRSDIVWNKPNCQPESVRDRPTRAHEYVFLFSKSERYKYDVSAVTGPNDRRLRTVWDIKTQAYPEASGHFATFPPALVDPCIRITTHDGDIVLDPFVGSGTAPLVAAELDRRFVGIELNPNYVDLARTRLDKAGLEEELAGSFGVAIGEDESRDLTAGADETVVGPPDAPRLPTDNPS